MREHYLGPYPFDPNLIAQGVPPDDRVDFNERIYAPVEGTPLPPGAVPAGTPPGVPLPGAPLPGPPPAAPAQAPLPPPPPGNSINGEPIPDPSAAPVDQQSAPVPPPVDGAVPAAPSAFAGNGSGVAAGPSVAVTHYDPQTGDYLTPDGQLQQLTNVAAGKTPTSWKDLLPI